MQTGDFVHIDYIGRIKGSGEIFDLTKEEIAKKDGTFNSNVKYKPIPVIIGANLFLKGIDETLKEMKIGEKKSIEISPKDSFGERKTELVKLIPLSFFKEKSKDVNPGVYVKVNEIPGKVVSVDGGRVKIDFNHPLAGKNLEYEIEVKEEIKTPEEKIKAIFNFYTGTEKEDVEVEIKEKKVEVLLKKKIELPVAIKERISSILLKWVKDLETIKFVDMYAK